MENYTNPGQSGQEQNSQDLINASLIFARALGLIFIPEYTCRNSRY